MLLQKEESMATLNSVDKTTTITEERNKKNAKLNVDNNPNPMLPSKESPPPLLPLTQQDKDFPSETLATVWGGWGLYATKDLPAGTRVQQFTTNIPEVEEDDYLTGIPLHERAHCLLYCVNLEEVEKEASKADNLSPKVKAIWRWRIPTSHARYANHSCGPNSFIHKNGLYLTTFLPLKKGEEITFFYNDSGSPGLEGGEMEPYFWDEAWSFNCECGAEKCQGRVNGYVERPAGVPA